MREFVNARVAGYMRLRGGVGSGFRGDSEDGE